MLALILLLLFGSIAVAVCGPVFVSSSSVGLAAAMVVLGVVVFIFDLFLMAGLKILNPNEALVFTLFGKYPRHFKGGRLLLGEPLLRGHQPRGRSRLYDHGQRQHQLQLWGQQENLPEKP